MTFKHISLKQGCIEGGSQWYSGAKQCFVGHLGIHWDRMVQERWLRARLKRIVKSN